LASYWTDAARDFETGLFRETASVRISPKGRALLSNLGALAVETGNNTAGPPDEAGWIHCNIPIESIEFGAVDLLRLGEEIEILAPVALRQAMLEMLQRITRYYA
jgi:predicted DNA-binding transcriptional regulator YafY